MANTVVIDCFPESVGRYREGHAVIAIDVVRGFPDRVARRPERYAMPRGRSGATRRKRRSSSPSRRP